MEEVLLEECLILVLVEVLIILPKIFPFVMENVSPIVVSLQPLTLILQLILLRMMEPPQPVLIRNITIIKIIITVERGHHKL